VLDDIDPNAEIARQRGDYEMITEYREVLG
jgi:hypothetical protein